MLFIWIKKSPDILKYINYQNCDISHEKKKFIENKDYFNKKEFLNSIF